MYRFQMGPGAEVDAVRCRGGCWGSGTNHHLSLVDPVFCQVRLSQEVPYNRVVISAGSPVGCACGLQKRVRWCSSWLRPQQCGEDSALLSWPMGFLLDVDRGEDVVLFGPIYYGGEAGNSSYNSRGAHVPPPIYKTSLFLSHSLQLYQLCLALWWGTVYVTMFMFPISKIHLPCWFRV